MKIFVKINSTLVLACFLFFAMSVFFAEAGEWRKKPFKDANGNDQYEYTEDGYKAKVSKKPFPNAYGQNEYKIEDNEGNSGVFRRKPFNDVYGNPVYEDTFTKQKQGAQTYPQQEEQQSESSMWADKLLQQGYVPAGATEQKSSSNNEIKSEDYFSKGRIALDSDAKIDFNYNFYNTTVVFKYESDTQRIAVQYLKPLLEGKGWTIVDSKNARYDLVTMPLFKKQDNFNNTGDSYMTMNLYFFRNPKTDNNNPVIDAFVAKRIISDNMQEEIKTMCDEIIKRIPNVKSDKDSDKQKLSKQANDIRAIPNDEE